MGTDLLQPHLHIDDLLQYWDIFVVLMVETKVYVDWLGKNWKEKRDYLIRNGTTDPISCVQTGSTAVSELNDAYYKKKNELRLVELFKQ